MRLLGLATALLLPMGALSLGVPPTAGGGPPALPPNWVAYQDPSVGKAYYYNTIDGRRQWEFPAPDEEVEPAVDTRGVADARQQDRWYTAHDHAGRVYYVDSYTGTSTYEPPPHFQPGYQDGSPASAVAGGGDGAMASEQAQPQQDVAGAEEVLRKEVEEARAELKRVEEELSRSKEAAGEAEALTKALAEAKERVGKLEEEREALSKELEAVKKEAEEAVRTGVEVQASVGNATAERDAALKTLEELRLKQQEGAKELDDAYKKLEELEGQHSQALDEVERLERELQRATHRAASAVHASHMGSGQGQSSTTLRSAMSFVRAFVPFKLSRRVSPEELEIAALNRSVHRLRENATALCAVIDSRNSLIDELNQRIEVFEEETLRRRRTVASLREAISELTEEVNGKAEETHALKEELRDLVQELLWKDANITTLEARALLGEARAAGLEAEVEMMRQEQGRGHEKAANLTNALKDAQWRTEALERELDKGQKAVEAERTRLAEVEEVAEERAARIGLLEQENKLLMEQLEDALDAARGVAESEREAARQEAARRQVEEEEAAAMNMRGGFGEGGEAGKAQANSGTEPPGGKKKKKGGFCWFGWL